MEGFELGGSMLAGVGAGDQAWRCILYSLQPSSLNGRKAMEYAVTIVQLTNNKAKMCMYIAVHTHLHRCVCIAVHS